jgi:hypothetical protein
MQHTDVGLFYEVRIRFLQKFFLHVQKYLPDMNKMFLSLVSGSTFGYVREQQKLNRISKEYLGKNYVK